jgi:hypothetical protein
MEQARGPYERPIPETVGLMAGNIQLNMRQYLVNHIVLAPALIWVGHTPLRQADAPHLPSVGRYVLWGGQLVLLGLALWQAVATLMWSSPATHGTTRSGASALALSFLAVVVFLTLVHTIIAVDDRFTTPALPLVGLFAGVRAASALRARGRLAVGYAA